MNKILISLTFVTVVGTLSGCATKQDLEALSVQQVKTNQELISIHEYANAQSGRSFGQYKVLLCRR